MPDIILSFFVKNFIIGEETAYFYSVGVIQSTLFIVGTSIGAGFLSGAELVSFFPTGGFFLPVIFSSALFCAACVLFLSLGKKYGGFTGAVGALFGRASKAMLIFVSLCSFIPCAGMLAGLDALFPQYRPLPALAGLLLVLCFLKKGMKGISLLNAVLVPFLLAFVLIFGCGNLSVVRFRCGFTPFFGGALYAFMNAFLAIPVLLDAGKGMKRLFPPAFFASCILAFAALCILSSVHAAGEGALGAAMPFLYVMRGRRLFFVAASCAILTSLASAIYPPLRLCDGFRGKKKYAAKGIVLLAAFALSRFGLAGIVRFLYPVLGVFGMTVSALCILNEYFFEKHHEKIHSRGKQTENAGRAHYEVELKHLPAVYYEITEPGAGNDVFAHNRTDPSHSHVDFQHGNKRGAGGGNDKLSQNLKLGRSHGT